ncbi:glycosyltransferase family 4 protein [Flavobacterium luteum]|uniref:Glycosyltransferase family 4 protein n=1 Tax=Flavobacterium luteum TaxID=2026654 RepID=A0A7J5AE29_9FLAO|nr:glycosyltransferase family 4 protein [Flavobacterium luteum]KAB1155836.1 glycosyltransferase family 4 protein [Flavobacterium luteum]
MIIFQLIQKPQKRGAEIFAAQLSEQLQQLGHKVILISLFEGVCDLPFSGKIIHLNRPLSKRWYDFTAWKKLAQLVKEYKPDLVQCNAGDTLKFAVLSKLIFGWKSLIVARNASTVSGYIKSKSTKKINEFLYSKTDAIISVSEYSKKDLNQLFPATKNKTTVIPIGVEKQVIHKVDWKEANNTPFNIIHVGGFTFEKNHKGLLDIWELFLKKQPNAILHLFGDGLLRKEIEKIVEVKKLGSSILFYGWVTNPLDYIAKADVLVLPSIIEGLPGVILEAMYCKTVVVANNVGGISEIVKPNETGFLAEKGNEEEFASLMKKAIDSNTNDIANQAYSLVEENFSNEYIVQQFEKTYLKISNGKN